jgi:hypothetical protein
MYKQINKFFNLNLNTSHCGAEEARQAHNLEVVGSKPTNASILVLS